MTKEEFEAIFAAIVALVKNEGLAVEVLYGQDLISWK